MASFKQNQSAHGLTSFSSARIIRTAAALAVVGMTAASVSAANLTWDPTQTASTTGGGTGTWDKTLLNWFDGASDTVWTDGNSAVFANAGGTVTLGVPISALNLQLTGTGYAVTPSASNTLTLTAVNGTAGTSANAIYAAGANNTVGGPLSLVGTTTANTVQYITAATGATLNLTGAITQANATTTGITVFGPGIVNYSGTGFTGLQTTGSLGIGKFNINGGATFNTSGAMTISNNGTYTGLGDTAATTWNVNTGSAVTDASTLFIGSGTGLNGSLVVNGGTASFVAINAGNSYNAATDTTGVGTITVNGGALTNTGTTKLGGGLGTGTLNLNGGTYSFGGTISKGPVTGTNTGGSATINFNGGILRPTANNLTINGLTALNVRNGGALIATNGQTATLAQALTHSAISGDNAVDGGLNKSGGGTLILTAANTYTGPTLVTGGGNLQIGNGGTTGSIPATAITVQDATSTLNINHSDDVTLGQTIGGLGIVSKSGTGNLFLTGTNTFAGGLSIGGGAGNVRLSANNAAGTGTVTINGQNAVTGTLELTGGITIPNNLTTVASRNDPTTAAPNAGVAQVRNVSGNNTITGNGFAIAAGGSGNLIESQAGTLTFTGTFSGNTSGSTYARPYYVYGAGNVAISGAISNGTATGGTAVIKQGAGTLTLSGANTYLGTTTLAAGGLRETSPAYTNSLANGGVDVQAGRFVLDYTATTTPVAQVKAILDAGYAQSTKFGTGMIRSTTAAAASRVLGYGDDGAGNVTVLYTIDGDANLDGKVDFNDFLVLQQNFGQANTRFDQGNFDYSGGTDFNDFLILQQNFGQSADGEAVAFTNTQVAALTAFALANQGVPEPTSLAVIGIGAVGLLRRRRTA